MSQIKETMKYLIKKYKQGIIKVPLSQMREDLGFGDPVYNRIRKNYCMTIHLTTYAKPYRGPPSTLVMLKPSRLKKVLEYYGED